MSRGTALRMLPGLILCVALAVPSSADIATGLVGHWPLNGDAVDAGGNGHDGTVVGAVTAVPDRNGNPDSAMNFPGQTAAYIDLGQPPELLIKGAMTVSAWVRADTLAQTGRIIAKQGPSSGRSWGLNLETAGHARFDLGVNPTDRVRADSQPLSFGPQGWFHLTGVFRPGEAVELYVNGQLAKSEPTTATTQWIENGLPVNIGRRPEPGTPWRGDIDEARIYARALSADDVKELYEYVPSPRLTAWAPQPVDGALDVALALLQWKPGTTAVLHDVYLGLSPELTDANLVGARLPSALYFHAPGLIPGTTYYWRVDEIEADLVTVHTGDVWSFLVQDLTAYHPTPAHGAVDVVAQPQLVWLPGQGAIEHHVYFSDSLDDVTQGAPAADKGTTKEPTFSPGTLESATTYFWRVDEKVAIGPDRPGPVWSFATSQPVDDFESYTDETGSRIYETWIDGYIDQSSGSTVGYIDAPFAEQTIVHGGKQSMPLDYNNLNSPFYSEAEREFSPVQDWTVNDVNALVVSVRGRSTNGAAPLYVTIRDSSNRTATVVHPDADVVRLEKWTEWSIPLSQFADAGVNLTRVKAMILGVGDKADAKPGAAGLIYVDDIRLIRATP